MKLLLDQDVYERTARFLQQAGHDVLRVSEIQMAESADESILNQAAALGRILITRDSDYGGLVFIRHVGSGVIFLRTTLDELEQVHQELAQVLSRYSATELERAFVVVQVRRHRIRKV
jgi:predicted nuclease of predicted toxin-antitoxin system